MGRFTCIDVMRISAHEVSRYTDIDRGYGIGSNLLKEPRWPICARGALRDAYMVAGNLIIALGNGLVRAIGPVHCILSVLPGLACIINTFTLVAVHGWPPSWEI